MGLNHPVSMRQWRRWERPGPVHRAAALARRRGRPASPPALQLAVAGPGPAVLVALDSANPSSRAALVDPARRLPEAEVAWLGPAEVLRAVGAVGPQTRLHAWRGDAPQLAEVERAASIGAHLPAGDAVRRWARRRGREHVIVQHGLLTAWAPPLPRGATLLAFTDRDGAFWASGRTDLTVHAVGSQALWQAARHADREAGPPAPAGSGAPPWAGAGPRPASAADGSTRPLVFLGQLHGRELPRAQTAAQTLGFLRRRRDTLYRPHPSERDALSRGVHAAMRRGGIRFQDSSVPLAETGADVVSLFSTGVLETATLGRRAWVHHTDPPPWLREFWGRYGLARWGQDPTPPAHWSDREPAQAVAEHLRTGGTR